MATEPESNAGSVCITELATVQNMCYEFSQIGEVNTTDVVWFDAIFQINQHDSQILMVALRYWNKDNIIIDKDHTATYMIEATVRF